MDKRPSIVFLIADDHRHEALGSSGNPVVRTPALDELAAGGAAMQAAHIFGGLTGAVCAPSRACVLTGQSIFRSMIGCDPAEWTHSTDIRPEVPLLPERLRDVGYQTYAVGKWHNDKASFARSFEGGDKLFFYGMSDHWNVPVQAFDPEGRYGKEREYVETRHSSEVFADAAIDFLERRDDERPFFLYVAFTAPHDPRTAPEPFASLFKPEEMALPPNFAAEHPFDNGDLGVRDERLASVPRRKEEIRRHMADYYAMIAHLDAQVGRIVDCLKAKGLYDDTLLVYTADHGLSVGQHGLMGKQNVYDHSIRIPLLLRGPGVDAGAKPPGLLSNIDIAPTVAELAGLPAQQDYDGISFAGMLRGDDGDVDSASSECGAIRANAGVMSASVDAGESGSVSTSSDASEAAANPLMVRTHVCTAYQDLQRMVKDRRWKLIRYYRSPASVAGTERVQLFDMEADPWETRDVSGDPANRQEMERLAQLLQSWMDRHDDILRHVPILKIQKG